MLTNVAKIVAAQQYFQTAHIAIAIAIASVIVVVAFV